MTIDIDYNKDSNLTEFAKELLRDYYMLPGEESPQDAFARAAVAFSAGDVGLAQRIYNYVSDGWFMFSTPVLSNAPDKEGKSRGLPISCFLNYVGDSRNGLCDHYTENAWLSSVGGGIGGHWSSVRSDGSSTSGGSQSTGIIPFLHMVDSEVLAFSQGRTRRGSYAAYLDVSHPEIMEFLRMRIPDGDPNRKNLNIHNAVNITDNFLRAVDKGFAWNLVDPHSGKIVDQVPARELWQTILETRFRTGEPYINYIDEANRRLPVPLKGKGLTIHGSNLCNEIHLPTSPNRTAVCCLSSVNLERFDEWKETKMVEDLVVFLDNVLQYFIDNAPDALSRAKYSAERERSLGLGAMGFHSYLQSKRIPFESALAKSANLAMFKTIKEQAYESTQRLAMDRGEYPDSKCYPVTEEGHTPRAVRNSHLLAIAPNANSGIMLDTSPSIEPMKANVYTQKTRAGTKLVRNKHLDKALREAYNNSIHSGDIDHWVEQKWKEILDHDGSVQEIDCFDDYLKSVFRTATEIDQRWVIDHARDRQAYICQGQSVNLFFPYGVDKAYVHHVHRRAFSSEGTGVPLKGLYYLRTNAPSSTEQVGLRVDREALKDYECIACEG